MQLKTVEEQAETFMPTGRNKEYMSIEFEVTQAYRATVQEIISKDRQDTITAVIEMVEGMASKTPWNASGEPHINATVLLTKLQALSPKRVTMPKDYQDVIDDLQMQVQELEQTVIEKESRIDTLETQIKDALYYLLQK